MNVAFILTTFSAVFFYLSCPNIISHSGFPFFAWIFLIPLFFALQDKNVFQRLQLGVYFGFLSYALLVQWLASISVGGFLLFVLTLMIQPVLFCVLSWCARGSVWFKALYMALLWTGLEYVRTILFDGFVWGIGYSQSVWPVMIQVAEWTGIYGVGFLIALVNYLLYGTLATRGAVRRYGLVACGLCVVIVFFALVNMMRFESQSDDLRLKVGVTQANIDPKQKLDLEQYDHNIMEHMRLTKQAVLQQPDLVVWPETALVDDYLTDMKWRRLIQKMIHNLNTPLLIGTATLQRDRDFNSALLVDISGNINYVYHKRYLVPFTEYLPHQFPFSLLAQRLDVTGVRFEQGQQLGLMLIKKENKPIIFGLAICSETGYPNLYRSLRLAGAQFYVSMLNDGWFQQKAALMMHLQQDVFRAVENRLPVIRSANTGVSAHIDARGRITSEDQLPLMKRAQGVFDMELHNYKPTFYTIFGDVFAQLCLVFVILIAACAAVTRCMTHVIRSEKQPAGKAGKRNVKR